MKTVRFKITEVFDFRKGDTEIKTGAILTGQMAESNNAIYYTDKAGTDWVFYVGDTCSLISPLDEEQEEQPYYTTALYNGDKYVCDLIGQPEHLSKQVNNIYMLSGNQITGFYHKKDIFVLKNLETGREIFTLVIQ